LQKVALLAIEIKIMAKKQQPEKIIMALTPSDFSRLYNIPKYAITRHSDRFVWAISVEGCKPKILDTEENRMTALEIESTRHKRFRKT
jgi:hypothetical protein